MFKARLLQVCIELFFERFGYYLFSFFYYSLICRVEKCLRSCAHPFNMHTVFTKIEIIVKMNRTGCNNDSETF